MIVLRRERLLCRCWSLPCRSEVSQVWRPLILLDRHEEAITAQHIGDLQHAVIAPLIGELRRRAPKLRVLVSPRQATGLADLMARGEIDLCVTLREVADSDLPSRSLYRDRYICVARRNHTLKARRISIKQLCAFDHLLVDPTGRSLSGPIDTVLAGVGHRRKVAAAVPSFHILFELLNSDDYIAFVPERLLRRRSDVRIFETNLTIPPLEVIASWHPRVSGDARHKWLRETLVAVAGARSRTVAASRERSGYTCRQDDVVVTAAHDSKRP